MQSRLGTWISRELRVQKASNAAKLAGGRVPVVSASKHHTMAPIKISPSGRAYTSVKKTTKTGIPNHQGKKTQIRGSQALT